MQQSDSSLSLALIPTKPIQALRQRERAKLASHIYRIFVPICCLTAAAISSATQSEIYHFESLGPATRHHQSLIPTATLSATTLLINQSLIESVSTTLILTQIAQLHLLLDREVNARIEHLSGPRRIALSTGIGLLLGASAGLLTSALSLTLDNLFPISIGVGGVVALINHCLIKNVTQPLYQFNHQSWLMPMSLIAFGTYLMWQMNASDTSYSTATEAELSPAVFRVHNQHFLPFMTHRASLFSWITSGTSLGLFALSCKSSSALLNIAFRLCRNWIGISSTMSMMHISANHFQEDAFNCTIGNTTYNQNQTAIFFNLDCPENSQESAFLNAGFSSILAIGGLYFAYRLRQHYIPNHVYHRALPVVSDITAKCVAALMVFIPDTIFPKATGVPLSAIAITVTFLSMLRYHHRFLTRYENILGHSTKGAAIKALNALYTGALYGGYSGAIYFNSVNGALTAMTLGAMLFFILQLLSNHKNSDVTDRLFHTTQFIIPVLRLADFASSDSPTGHDLSALPSNIGLYTSFLLPISPFIAAAMDIIQQHREKNFGAQNYQNIDHDFKVRDAHILCALFTSMMTIAFTTNNSHSHRTGNARYQLDGQFRDFVYADIDAPNLFARRAFTISASLSSLYLVTTCVYRVMNHHQKRQALLKDQAPIETPEAKPSHVFESKVSAPAELGGLGAAEKTSPCWCPALCDLI